MMDETVFDDTKTQSSDSSLPHPFSDGAWMANDVQDQQQQQQPEQEQHQQQQQQQWQQTKPSFAGPSPLYPLASQNSDDLVANAPDEYTHWILTSSQKKSQRETQQQWKNQPTTATVPTTATITSMDRHPSGIDNGHKDDSNAFLGSGKHQPTDLLTGDTGSKAILQQKLQQFDPLNNDKTAANSVEKGQKARRRHTSVGSSGISMNGGGQSQKPATAPTRLPTPKSSSIHLSSHVPRSAPDTVSSLPVPTTKPRRTRHLSSNDGLSSQRRQQLQQQQRQAATTNWLDFDTQESTVIPIAPRKQDAQQRPVSMISSFVTKSSTGACDSDLLKGKANRQLVDFDPFLSREPLEGRDAFKYMDKDETSVAGGPKTSPRHSTTTFSTNSCTTRIPLPISKKSSNSGDEDDTADQNQRHLPPSTTKPKTSPSRNCKQQEPQDDTMIIHRPSLLTNDALKDRRTKDQNISQHAGVNLISVQGELCVPDCISQPEELDAEQQQQHDAFHHHQHSPSSTSPTSLPLQRRVSSLHERLQELVHDGSAWNEISKSTTDHSGSTWPDEDEYMAPLSSSSSSVQQQHVPIDATVTEQQPKRRLRTVPATSFHSTRTIPDSVTTNNMHHPLSTSVPSPSVSPPTPQSFSTTASASSTRPGMSSSTAFKLYRHHLSPFEHQEILKYPQIYFVGNHLKKHQATMDQTTNNYGYDDERGDYLIVPKDHLAYRYEVLETMGKGSFGLVVKAFDYRLGTNVAVKLIRNKKRFHAQALVEVKTLEDLMKWDPDDKHNIVRMTDHFYFRNHLCIAFECLSINLYDFIKSNNFQGSSMGLIRRFTIQLLNSLVLLYQHHLIHCDLKPENVLLKHPTRSTIKVIDFGSSCLDTEKVYTYIQSRFYRAPEVILGLEYGMAIDMWSVGCILAELYTGYPLFPGENEQDQLACIMEVQGVPSRDMVERSARRKTFFDFYGNPKIMPNSKGKKRKPGTKTLTHILKCSDGKFVDFIDQCLQWDPDDRIKPDEAFKHGWIARPHHS